MLVLALSGCFTEEMHAAVGGRAVVYEPQDWWLDSLFLLAMCPGFLGQNAEIS